MPPQLPSSKKNKTGNKNRKKSTKKKSKIVSKEFVDPVSPEIILPPPTSTERLVSLLLKQPMSEKEMFGIKLPSHILQEFSSQEIRDLHQIFTVFDFNSNGLLHAKDVYGALLSLGFKTTFQKTLELIEAVANQKTNFADFRQFLECVIYQQDKTKDSYEEINICFSALDLNQDGQIDLSDLEKVAKNLGLKFSRQEFLEMIEAADTNGDGKVDFMEFGKVMLRTNLFFSEI